MIGDQYQPREIHLTMSEHELAAATEAAHDALLRRVRWSVTREPAWAALPFEIARESIAQLTSVYTKVVFSLRDLPEEALHPDFFDHFGVRNDMWEIINEITFGSTWDDVPVHPHTPGDPKRPECQLCEQFESA